MAEVKTGSSGKTKVEFINVLQPGTNLQFRYNGKKYVLEDRKVYTLPDEIIEHLESLSYPDPRRVKDKKTGEWVVDTSRRKFRFDLRRVK